MRSFDEKPTPDEVLWDQTISDDLAEKAEALHELGRRAAVGGQAPRAAELLTAAIAVLEQLGDDTKRAWSLFVLACVLNQAGRHDDAHDSAVAASAMLRMYGDECQVALAMRANADALIALGRLDEAEPELLSALALFENCDDHRNSALCTDALAALCEKLDALPTAVEWRRQSLVHRQRLDNHLDAANAMVSLGRSLRRAGAHEESAQTLRVVLEHWRYVERPIQVAETLCELGQTLLAFDDPHAARVALDEASALFKAHDDFDSAADVDGLRADALRDLDRFAEAAQLDEQVLAYHRVRGHIDSPEALKKPAPVSKPQAAAAKAKTSKGARS
jgi:tetratricopeptide (TPR) repeat protein